MLCGLLAIAACRRTQTALGVIQMSKCRAIIDDRLYDLNTINTSQVFSYPHKYGDKTYTYYFKMCKPLTRADIPGKPNVELDDALLARCVGINDDCIPLVFLQDFLIQPMVSTHAPDSGLFYEADGPAFKDYDNIFRTFDVDIILNCDPNIEDVNLDLSATFTVDDNAQYVVMHGTSKHSCNKTAPTPLPSPTPKFETDCTYLYHLPGSEDYGYNIDLIAHNTGLFGTRVPVTIDGEEYIVFFQPCERSECPLDFTCVNYATDNVYSSVWLCNKSRICDRFGVMGSVADIKIDSNIGQAYNVTYNNSENIHKTLLQVKCNTILKEDHFIFDANGKLEAQGNRLELSAFSNSACLKVIPDPPPTPDKCYFSKTIQNYAIDINLTHFSLQGYQNKMKLKEGAKEKDVVIHYVPCEGMLCPTGAQCEGDEHASVWLCDIDAQSDETNCVAYGLWTKSLSIAMNNKFDIFGGINAYYSGDRSRVAQVHHICKESLEKDVLEWGNTAYLDYKTLQFDVYSRNACPKGSGPTPTPYVEYKPPRPQKGSTPTPKPIPSPNPLELWHNETHYIEIDLSRLYQEVFRGKLFLLGLQQLVGHVYVEYDPWNQLPCPQNYSCDEFQNSKANVWACWDNYCHPAGDKHIGIQINKLNNGAYIRYDGAYGVDAEFRIDCDPALFSNAITLGYSSAVIYHTSLTAPEFVFNSTSGAVCAQKFSSPTPIPDPAPTNSPKNLNPNVVFSTSYIQDGKNYTVSLDLNKVPIIEGDVVLGYSSTYELGKVKYSPVEHVPCPVGNYKCIGDNTNVWRCVNTTDGQQTCYSIGDSYYDFTIGLINKDHPDYGVEVYYHGGMDNRTASFYYQCRYDLADGEYIIEDIGVRSPWTMAGQLHHMNIHSRHVCPVELIHKSITGGAIFLLIVVTAALGYFVIGTLVIFITKGTVAIPNESFWMEFVGCIQTAVVFIFTCNRNKSMNMSYDAI